MKQLITAEQLGSLTTREMGALYKWMVNRGYWHSSLDRMEYLPSIGQLIEFLEDNHNHYKDGCWSINFYRTNVSVEGHEAGELINALWLAVIDRLDVGKEEV